MADCPYTNRCLNGPQGKDQCFRCFDLRLLQLPEDKVKGRLGRRRPVVKADVPSHVELERRVASDFSKPLTTHQYMARQNPGSGNVWFRPGDVLHDLLLIECKERQGAAKSIRVQKDWLDKALAEGRLSGKPPLVAFRFKETEEIYSFMALNDIVALVQQLQFLQEELRRREEDRGCAP